METVLPFIYTALWFVLGFVVMFLGLKNKFGLTTLVLSVMFYFMGVWWLVNALISDIDMMNGTYGWVFRIVISVFVLITAFCYLSYKKKHK